MWGEERYTYVFNILNFDGIIHIHYLTQVLGELDTIQLSIIMILNVTARKGSGDEAPIVYIYVHIHAHVHVLHAHVCTSCSL